MEDTYIDDEHDGPLHRRPPPPQVISSRNDYVRAINEMRSEIRHAINPNGNILGSISHALDNVPGFGCSASEWTKQHLTRFQTLVLEGQVSSYLFPDIYMLEDTDDVMLALINDGFFDVEMTAVAHGQWNTDKLHHFFFLNMMVLLRGGDKTPTPRTSPRQQVESHPRDAKDLARSRIRETFMHRPSLISDSTASLPGHARVPSMDSTDSSVSSMHSLQSNTAVDYGPRETITFTLIHNLLAYLGTMEHKNSKSKGQLWIPSYCPSL
jgi:hypothetical protein